MSNDYRSAPRNREDGGCAVLGGWVVGAITFIGVWWASIATLGPIGLFFGWIPGAVAAVIVGSIGQVLTASFEELFVRSVEIIFAILAGLLVFLVELLHHVLSVWLEVIHQLEKWMIYRAVMRQRSRVSYDRRRWINDIYQFRQRRRLRIQTGFQPTHNFLKTLTDWLKRTYPSTEESERM